MVTQFLTGAPRTWATERPEEDSWEEWKLAFRTSFMRTAGPAEALKEVLSLRFGEIPWEAFRTKFAEKIKLVPYLDEPGKIELLTQTLPGSMEFEVRKGRPQTLEDAYWLIDLLNSNYQERAARRRAAAPHDGAGSRKTPYSRPAPPPPMRSVRVEPATNPGARDRACWRCGQTGHVRARCPQRAGAPSAVNAVGVMPPADAATYPDRTGTVSRVQLQRD